ncbi:GIY-YIG nuclease family protein [Paenibacillus periandrae]|uniref:GIY-YIG nuclease family protein n=1 Tax=Paenibacillus periandrae TaxID=1761741 RepID=UPI001F092677|nr:GIY-YIG nuclease family protein [Paenibacillus periandrae]
MGKPTEYYWIRVYDYISERDRFEKGTKLDEFYLKETDREAVKQHVRDKYCSNTAKELKFAKPKKGTNGIYAIVMDSTKFFHDHFYCQLDTICFWCNTPIKGKASEYPREYIGEGLYYDSEDEVFSDLTKTAFFCRYACKSNYNNSQRNIEGEFQVKEEGANGDIFGYIYLIYNRDTGSYYVGQTRFLPFFRWQEQVKSGQKGDISDMSFSVLAQVNRNRQESDEQNQQYLNSIESWWIQKYQKEHPNVINIVTPKITIEYLKDRFTEMVEKQALLF